MKKSNQKVSSAICPVSEQPCPEGKGESALCCQRFTHDFDPMNNFRDFAMICCAMDKQRMESGSMRAHS